MNLRQIEQAKHEWEVTVDSLPQFVCLLDDHGRIIRANRTLEKWNLGQVLDVKGRRVHELLHPGCTNPACYLEIFMFRAWEELSRGQPAEYEAEDRVLKRHLYFQFRPISAQADWEGRAIFAVAIVHDVTERKRAEDTLRKNLAQLAKKNRYETIINTVTQSVHKSINLQDVLENAVEAMKKNIDGVDNVSIYLVEGEEAVLKAYRGYPDWFIKRVGRIPYPKGFTWKTIIEGKPGYCADVDKDTVIGPAGREMGTKSYASMPISCGGKTVGAININSLQKNAFDEEDLKLLEIVAQQIEVAINNAQQAEALRESEERYRSLVETAPEVIFSLSAEDGAIISLNPAFEKITGWSRAEWLGKSFTGIVHPDDLLIAIEKFQQALRGETPALFELRFLSKSGEYLVGEVIGTPQIKNGRVLRVFGFVRDITDRKRMEEALRGSEEKYRTLVEHTYDLICETNVDGRFLYASPKHKDVLGYELGELLGRSIFEHVHSDDRPVVIAEFQRAAKTFSTGHAVCRYRHKNGEWRWFESTGKPFQTASGEVRGVIASRDITKQIEIQEKLIHKEKLASLGEMAAGVAHEIRNPLGGIKVAASSIRRDLSENSFTADMLDSILSGVKHIENIINDLLDFTRETKLEKEDYNIARIIRGVVNSFHREISEKGIQVLYNRFHENINLNVDGIKIRQVFTNILKNAIEAINHEEGKILINLYGHGSDVLVEFIDNGVGILKENLEKIYYPFFTTKPNGIGLGMAIVRKIVDLHKGDIDIKSVPGEGTIVRIILPTGGISDDKKYSNS